MKGGSGVCWERHHSGVFSLIPLQTYLFPVMIVTSLTLSFTGNLRVSVRCVRVTLVPPAVHPCLFPAMLPKTKVLVFSSGIFPACK